MLAGVGDHGATLRNPGDGVKREGGTPECNEVPAGAEQRVRGSRSIDPDRGHW